MVAVEKNPLFNAVSLGIDAVENKKLPKQD